MDWTRTEVDGVPVYWSAHPEDTGDEDLRAGLVFRVGQADEPLARRGITHLIEHLALHGIGQPLDHVNGEVDATTTTFYRRGSAEQVTAFLGSVCAALRDLPFERTAAEVQVLRTEAASRSNAPAGPLLIWRYGARTYGMPGYEEFGIGYQRPEDLRVWADYWFTRGNAVLWLVGGPPPAGLRLELPDGPRIPPPSPSSALPRTPAYFPERTTGIGLLSVVDRSMAAGTYAMVLRNTLHQVLRNELGISYHPVAAYDPRDAASAHLSAFADGLPEVGDKLVAGFTDVLDRLAEEPVPAEELSELIAVTRRDVQSAKNGWAASVTINAANAELVGAAPVTMAAWDAEFGAVTPADIRSVAAQARDNALLMVPGNHRPPGTRYSAAPTGSPGTVDGHVLTPVDGSHKKLVVGPFGVSRAVGLTFATVKYAECQLMNAWPDGTRQLFGADGITIHVDPAQWQGGYIAPGIIDAHVPPSVVLVQPARPSASTPQPVAAQPNQRRGLFRKH